MKFKKIILFLFIILFVASIGIVSNADMGVKPSIKLTLTNIDSDDYIVDLLTEIDSSDKSFIDNLDTNSTDYKDLTNEPIYLYNENGWVATAMRDSLLFGSVIGNSDHINYFNYFDVPEEFKIIIQMPDGTIKVSDLIKKTDYNASYTIDVNTMEVTNNLDVSNKIVVTLIHSLSIIVPVVCTLIIELIIALFMINKSRNNFIILIITNIITNVLLNSLLISTNFSYIFVIEILIIIAELLVYLKFIKDTKKSKIIIYTIIANLISALFSMFCTGIVYMLVSGLLNLYSY